MWFKGSNGLYYTDEDIKLAAYIADGIDIKGDDNVESYALTCKGILRECEPTVDDLIKSGQRAKAVILYRSQHSGVSFLDAKNFVDELTEKLIRNSNREPDGKPEDWWLSSDK